MAVVSFLVYLFLSVCLLPSSPYPVHVCVFCLPKGLNLIGTCFSAVHGGQREELWQDFFVDSSQWWDHRSEKVIEHCNPVRAQMSMEP
jgi:hypothetical protein